MSDQGPTRERRISISVRYDRCTESRTLSVEVDGETLGWLKKNDDDRGRKMMIHLADLLLALPQCSLLNSTIAAEHIVQESAIMNAMSPADIANVIADMTIAEVFHMPGHARE